MSLCHNGRKELFCMGSLENEPTVADPKKPKIFPLSRRATTLAGPSNQAIMMLPGNSFARQKKRMLYTVPDSRKALLFYICSSRRGSRPSIAFAPSAPGMAEPHGRRSSRHGKRRRKSRTTSTGKKRMR